MTDAHLRLACPRTRTAKPIFDEQGQPTETYRYMPNLPIRWIEALEQNQQIASCCRHPENHEIAAYYSSAEDEAKGIPDIYIFFCTCGRAHRRFCIGGSKDPVTKEVTHPRPFWEIR
jgi:hypothetical protein